MTLSFIINPNLVNIRKNKYPMYLTYVRIDRPISTVSLGRATNDDNNYDEQIEKGTNRVEK